LRLKAELDDGESYLGELRNLDITLPTISFDSSLFLPGSRPIELHNFGRGHTAGDVVVFLPHELVLVTGDLFLGPHIPYAADSYPSEWVMALKKTSQLDFDQVALGHTPPVRGEEARAQMQRLITFMEDAVSHPWRTVHCSCACGGGRPSIARSFPNENAFNRCHSLYEEKLRPGLPSGHVLSSTNRAASRITYFWRSGFGTEKICDELSATGKRKGTRANPMFIDRS